MKKNYLVSLMMLMWVSLTSVAQQGKENINPRLGQEAPSFVGKSTKGEIHFPQDYFAKWKILFSHPADFTPVCTSEIIELARLYEDFKKLNTVVLVISTDGLNSHHEWINSMEKMWYKNQDPVSIKFPLISDNDLIISKLYGMMKPDDSDRRDVRGVFIIDPQNKIRAYFFYPESVGRNMEEIKRTLVALQTNDKDNMLTPANWKPGDDKLLHTPGSLEEANRMGMAGDPDRYNYDWYVWFEKQKK
jgi:peroxiredoxin (alkyl hydroperoxide reductase subunit C)